MANIKTTPEQWEKARALFESGLKLKEISERTKIAIPNISKKSNAENWSKETEKQTLIVDEARVKAAKATFSNIELQVHNDLVDEKTRDLVYFNTAQKKLAAVGLAYIDSKLDKNGRPSHDFNVQDLTGVSKVIKDSREGVVGKAPDTAIQINNNVQAPRIAFEVIEH